MTSHQAKIDAHVDWPTNKYDPEDEYSRWTFLDPPWLHVAPSNDGIIRWDSTGMGGTGEIMFLPRDKAADHLIAPIAHYLHLDSVRPTPEGGDIGFRICKVTDTGAAVDKEVWMVFPADTMSAKMGDDRCSGCANVTPSIPCHPMAWTPPVADTLDYPRISPAGQKEAILHLGCIACFSQGKKCSKYGKIMTPDKLLGKANGLFNDAPLPEVPVAPLRFEDFFSLPPGFRLFTAAEQKEKERVLKERAAAQRKLEVAQRKKGNQKGSASKASSGTQQPPQAPSTGGTVLAAGQPPLTLPAASAGAADASSASGPTTKDNSGGRAEAVPGDENGASSSVGGTSGQAETSGGRAARRTTTNKPGTQPKAATSATKSGKRAGKDVPASIVVAASGPTTAAGAATGTALAGPSPPTTALPGSALSAVFETRPFGRPPYPLASAPPDSLGPATYPQLASISEWDWGRDCQWGVHNHQARDPVIGVRFPEWPVQLHQSPRETAPHLLPHNAALLGMTRLVLKPVHYKTFEAPLASSFPGAPGPAWPPFTYIKEGVICRKAALAGLPTVLFHWTAPDPKTGKYPNPLGDPICLEACMLCHAKSSMAAQSCDVRDLIIFGPQAGKRVDRSNRSAQENRQDAARRLELRRHDWSGQSNCTYRSTADLAAGDSSATKSASITVLESLDRPSLEPTPVVPSTSSGIHGLRQTGNSSNSVATTVPSASSTAMGTNTPTSVEPVSTAQQDGGNPAGEHRSKRLDSVTASSAEIQRYHRQAAYTGHNSTPTTQQAASSNSPTRSPAHITAEMTMSHERLGQELYVLQNLYGELTRALKRSRLPAEGEEGDSITSQRTEELVAENKRLRQEVAALKSGLDGSNVSGSDGST